MPPGQHPLARRARRTEVECFESLRGKPEVKAVVLACAGKTFLSGGDMREFETGMHEPGYHEVLRLIEDSAVPVVAALHGTAMGGGVETALACHYRVAAGRNAHSACPRSRWASFPAPAARSACRA